MQSLQKSTSSPGREDSPGPRAQRSGALWERDRPGGRARGDWGGKLGMDSATSLSAHLSLPVRQPGRVSQMCSVCLGLDDLKCRLRGNTKLSLENLRGS